MQLLQILTCHSRRGEEPRWREGRRHLQGDEDGHPACGAQESGEQGAEAGGEEGAHPHLAAQVQCRLRRVGRHCRRHRRSHRHPPGRVPQFSHRYTVIHNI